MTYDDILGMQYIDQVTGFRGVATAVTEWLNGCRRVCLEAVNERGEPLEYWFDEQRLDAVKRQVDRVTVAVTGGARAAPPRTGTGRVG